KQKRAWSWPRTRRCNMNPRPQSAGITGILAGIALVGEFTLFAISGFPGAAFSDPAAALPYLRDGGALLRAAVLFGAAGVAFSTVFFAGLAARLYAKTPTLAVATLYFAIVGSVGHGLVALPFWLGVPFFTDLAARDQLAAANAWGAFVAITSGAEGFGNLFLALSLLTAGWAIVSEKALPVSLGWISLIGGVATVVRVLGL